MVLALVPGQLGARSFPLSIPSLRTHRKSSIREAPLNLRRRYSWLTDQASTAFFPEQVMLYLCSSCICSAHWRPHWVCYVAAAASPARPRPALAPSMWPAPCMRPEGRLVTAECFLWALSGLWDTEDSKPVLSVKRSVSSRNGEPSLLALSFLAWEADDSLSLGSRFWTRPAGGLTGALARCRQGPATAGTPGPGNRALSGRAQLLGAWGSLLRAFPFRHVSGTFVQVALGCEKAEPGEP